MKANKLLLAARHRAEVQLPIEGELPSLSGATAWLNSPPLSAVDLRGHVVLDRLLDLHLHQLAAHPSLCARVGREISGARRGDDRRALA